MPNPCVAATFDFRARALWTEDMKVCILPQPAEVIDYAADLLVDHLAVMPDTVLGLATGQTMVPLYDELVRRYRDGLVSFAGVTSFNLDEYIGLGPDHPRSFHAFMATALFTPTDMDIQRAHLPRGDAPDPAAEALRYEAMIRAAGGIDLQLLGIGKNGHIGFNEPGSRFASRTCVKALAASTRAANQLLFHSEDDVPRFAITMGIATILDARRCLLLATGRAKAAAVAAMIEGPVSTGCPASALQGHRYATVLLDAAAASDLRHGGDYHLERP